VRGASRHPGVAATGDFAGGGLTRSREAAKGNAAGREGTGGIHATHPGTAVPGSPGRNFRSSGFPARALSSGTHRPGDAAQQALRPPGGSPLWKDTGRLAGSDSLTVAARKGPRASRLAVLSQPLKAALQPRESEAPAELPHAAPRHALLPVFCGAAWCSAHGHKDAKRTARGALEPLMNANVNLCLKAPPRSSGFPARALSCALLKARWWLARVVGLGWLSRVAVQGGCAGWLDPSPTTPLPRRGRGEDFVISGQQVAGGEFTRSGEGKCRGRSDWCDGLSFSTFHFLLSTLYGRDAMAPSPPAPLPRFTGARGGFCDQWSASRRGRVHAKRRRETQRAFESVFFPISGRFLSCQWTQIVAGRLD